MTAPAFTPGPWHIFPSGSAAERSLVEINNKSGMTVAYAVKFVPAYAEQSDANANLIAAAPDLYEALQTLVSMHIKRGPFDEPLGSSEQEDEINVACAALTKARGGQA